MTCHPDRHSAFSPSARVSGFSLIELVTVILIVGIIILVAVERGNVASSVRARMAANELAVNLRYVRNAAMQRERTMRVSFDLVSNSYAVAEYDSSTPGNFAAARNPADQKDWIVSISQRFPGIALAAVDMNGGTVVLFSGTNGAPFGADGTAFISNGVVALNSGVAVSVAPVTGYVRIE